jgi:thiol-disulfide isomerase/thioredoxin
MTKGYRGIWLETEERGMSITRFRNRLAAGFVAVLCPLAQPQSQAQAPAQPQPADKPAAAQPESPKQPEPPPVIVPLTPPGKSLVKIGDPAPELKVQSWVKGDPIKGYDRGKVYVVELWATWCAPCIETIPRLTQLQRDYKDKGLRVIGVSIWENTPPHTIGDLPIDASDAQANLAYLARVKGFVKDMGDKMEYSVAFDGIEGTTSAWMFRTGQSGIPCAYIVNREGKLAWIGHPGALFKPDGPLTQILAGNYDLANAPNQIAKDAAKDKKVRDLGIKYRTAEAKGDKAAQVALLGDLIELSPEEFAPEITMRFRMMLVDLKDDQGAYAYARKVAAGTAKDLFNPLNDMAWIILDDDAVARRDYDVALTLALRADEVAKHENPTVMDTLARAYFEKGDIDKAIETLTKAMALLDSSKADPSLRHDMETALRKYKAAKK